MTMLCTGERPDWVSTPPPVAVTAPIKLEMPPNRERRRRPKRLKVTDEPKTDSNQTIDYQMKAFKLIESYQVSPIVHEKIATALSRMDVIESGDYEKGGILRDIAERFGNGKSIQTFQILAKKQFLYQEGIIDGKDLEDAIAEALGPQGTMADKLQIAAGANILIDIARKFAEERQNKN